MVCVQTSQPTLETFEKLLADNRLTFFSLRTAKSLQTHWLLMKQYHILPDQTGITVNKYCCCLVGDGIGKSYSRSIAEA